MHHVFAELFRARVGIVIGARPVNGFILADRLHPGVYRPPPLSKRASTAEGRCDLECAARAGLPPMKPRRFTFMHCLSDFL